MGRRPVRDDTGIVPWKWYSRVSEYLAIRCAVAGSGDTTMAANL